MEIGTTLPTWCTGERLIPPEQLGRYAAKADEIGIAGLWALDHLVRTPIYSTSMLDPLVSLGHAAAVTDNITLGTSILLLPLRRTANVASRALSLQHLSNGRVTLGLGAGYVPKEFEAVGVPRTERGPRLHEGILVLNELFQGEASFEGRFHSFEGVRIDPVLDDPPQLLSAGSSMNADPGEWGMPEPILQRVLETGGWIAPPCSPEQAEHDWDIVRTYAEEHGVSPTDLEFVVLNYTHLVDDADRDAVRDEQRDVFEGFYSTESPRHTFEAAQDRCLVGTVEEVIERICSYEAIGVDHLIAGAITHRPDYLDQQLKVFDERILPAVH